MKKSLIALAVAGAMTAPIVAQADATLYGSFRAGVVSQGYADGTDADLNMRDESSRVGIKGDVDLGLEDTKGLFHFEHAISTADGNWKSARLAYMGATGSWGTALIGKQYHPYYTMVNSHTNIFNSADKEFGETFALGNENHKRENQTLAYASPVMSGFQVVAGIVVSSDNDDSNDFMDDDVDGYNIGAQYTGIEGLRLSASYGDVDAGDVYESDIWGLGATYSINAFTVAAKYEDREDSFFGNDNEWKVWELAGQYQMGATALKARYGNIDLDVDGGMSEDGDQWGIEVEHKLGKKGRVWVGYTDLDEEAAVLASALHGEVIAEDTLVLGYRLDF